MHPKVFQSIQRMVKVQECSKVFTIWPKYKMIPKYSQYSQSTKVLQSIQNMAKVQNDFKIFTVLPKYLSVPKYPQYAESTDTLGNFGLTMKRSGCILMSQLQYCQTSLNQSILKLDSSAINL